MATTLEMLLAALSEGNNLPPVPPPAPSMPLPVRTAGATPGPALSAAPEVPPVAPLPAADMNFVNQFAGAAPTAPVQRNPSFIDKLSTVLLGFGAGIQGRGPQFIESIREERERPIREYQAQLERFQNRRTQGLEIDERRRERAQDMATRRAERQADREFEQWAQRAKITDEIALQQARQAFDLQKLREQERIQDERDDRKARAETEKQRRGIENELASKDGAPPNIAKEISEWRVGLRPELSPAAQKWQGLQARKLAAQLARIGGGGGSGTDRAVVELTDSAGNPLGRMRYSELKFSNDGTLQGFPSGTQVRFPQAQPPSLPGVSPTGIPLALGTPGAPQPSVETLPGGIRMTTPGTGLTKPQQARFNDIKREQPNATDDQILNYMQKKGWLK